MNKKMNNLYVKRIARHGKIALTIAILCFGIGVVIAIPQQPYTLYGAATLDGKILTVQDDDIISLKVEGVELVSYTMGDIPTTDNYVLRVPMDSDPNVTTAAQEGDTAYIYINGIAINEGAQIIGAPGTTVQFDISATSVSKVTVLYPNGGESIPVGTQVQVSARATDDNAVTGVIFYYSSGTSWNLIGAGAIVSGTNKDGIWNKVWDTDGLSACTNYLINAVASDGTLTSDDQSDSTFSLTSSKVIRVPVDYPTIQAAVDAASAGNTIIVREGTYNENIDVNKCITLQGEDRNTTIIDTEGVTVEMSCDSTITGFTIKKGTYGIECTNPIAPHIADNIFTELGTCIMVWDSSASPVITDNEFIDNYHGCIWISSSAVISNNTFYNNGDGIFNDGGGIDTCIFIVGSSSPIITGNIIINNSAFGIVTATSPSSPRITSNIISGNEMGILDWGGSSFTIFNNTISDNEYGVYLFTSTNSIIYFNNFLNNDYNAYSSDSTSLWNSLSKITYTYNGNTYTSYLGNYWDDYTGSDADGDGIGDAPYGINSDKDIYPLLMPVENYITQPTITIDTTPPKVTIISPEDGRIYPMREIPLEVIANEPIAKWSYSLNGAAPVTFTPNITLTAREGDNSLVVYAEDFAGKEGSATVSFRVFTVAPTITNVKVSPTYAFPGDSIDIFAEVFDSSGVRWVRAFATKGGEYVCTIFLSGPEGTGGTYTGTWRTTGSTDGGIYNITISAADTEGNEALAKPCKVEIAIEATDYCHAPCRSCHSMQTGSIVVSSSPSGANIGLDGVPMNALTPYTIINVASGHHTLKLTLSGYEDWSISVYVTAAETTYVDATLDWEAPP